MLYQYRHLWKLNWQIARFTDHCSSPNYLAILLIIVNENNNLTILTVIVVIIVFSPMLKLGAKEGVRVGIKMCIH